ETSLIFRRFGRSFVGRLRKIHMSVVYPVHASRRIIVNARLRDHPVAVPVVERKLAFCSWAFCGSHSIAKFEHLFRIPLGEFALSEPLTFGVCHRASSFVASPTGRCRGRLTRCRGQAAPELRR